MAQRAFADASLPLAAPHLVDIEFTSACWRLVLQGKLTVSDAEEMLRRFATIQIERHAHGPLLPRVWELRDRLGAYDACYVALAERLQAGLLTADVRLSRVPGLRATITVLS